MNEAETRRRLITPKLIDAGWDKPPCLFNEEHYFTDGRVVVTGNKARRQIGKRADYILRHSRDYPIAVVEAKSDEHPPGTGLQQAKDYAQILDLKFAYATNGNGIIEFDYITGQEQELPTFPTPHELWARLRQSEGITDEFEEQLLTPSYRAVDKGHRYYQQIAIHRTVKALLKGQRRVLLAMATGTGKTVVAFQICWKLWNARWNRIGEHRRPRVLYLADRTVLVDDPKDKTFTPLGDARHKIVGEAVKSRELYFATYQAIAKDERRPGIYREYAPDFFDLIIVDECHRGSARDDSNWREILEYFDPAYQLGMTATPLRADNRDTYQYFGDPVFTYSLKQGIEDGFLAPYRVHRVVTTWDAAGWRPSQDEVDRYGRDIPDGEYQTKDFERIVALKARTEAIARHLTDFLKKTNRLGKTIVFCVDQEHADEMRRAITNLNSDMVQQYPDYVCRITSDEGDIGRGHLSRFQDVETVEPTIVTTSKLLTTGVDVPTCRNIALVSVIGSMTEFKQIIGRGTRVRDDYEKLFFNILDYTGSATRLFADPDFDGEPEFAAEEQINEAGETTEEKILIDEKSDDGELVMPTDEPGDGDEPVLPRKFYFDGGQVEIAAHVVYELDSEGNQLEVVSYTDYTANRVRSIFRNSAELRGKWGDPEKRAEILSQLGERGIDLDELRTVTGQPEADPFDLLCHVSFNAPLRTRRERAERVRREKQDFFDQYGPEAKAILDDLLDKYTDFGVAQFAIPEVLQVPPISERGNIVEITQYFGGPEKLRGAVTELQSLLYAA